MLYGLSAHAIGAAASTEPNEYGYDQHFQDFTPAVNQDLTPAVNTLCHTLCQSLSISESCSLSLPLSDTIPNGSDQDEQSRSPHPSSELRNLDTPATSSVDNEADKRQLKPLSFCYDTDDNCCRCTTPRRSRSTAFLTISCLSSHDN
jgi:hypothetical protein